MARRADFTKGKLAGTGKLGRSLTFGQMTVSSPAARAELASSVALAPVWRHVFRDGKLHVGQLADGGIYAFGAGPSR